MKLNIKECLIIKTKKYLKKNKLFFLFNGVNTSAYHWRKTERGLDTMEFLIFRSLNKTTTKKLKNSTFKYLKEIVSGLAFFLKPKNKAQHSKDVLLFKFSPLLLTLLAIKVNNKIYPAAVLKKNQNIINYASNSLLFHQFNVTNLKRITKL